MSDPDGWRDIDKTQREEIARLRSDAEYSFKRISELEEENKRLREALRRTQIAIDAYHSISGVVDMGLADAARHAETVLTRTALSQED